MVEAVDRTGLVLLVTQSLRGRPDFIDAKRACDAGEIGELFMAEAHYMSTISDPSTSGRLGASRCRRT